MDNKQSNLAVDSYLNPIKLRMADKEKYINIKAINSNISNLYKTIGATLAPDFNTNLVINSSCYHSDIVIYTQNIAKQITNSLGLCIVKVVVTFVPNLGVPGRVQLSAGNSFLVEIDNMYISKTNLISAILAHEIAHIYLFKHNISFKDTLQNEVLTDTTAAFLGCAWLILNSSYEETSFSLTTVNWFGYITQYEVGYILAKRDFLLKQNSSDAMIYGRSNKVAGVSETA
jgi:hypothetical protein